APPATDPRSDKAGRTPDDETGAARIRMDSFSFFRDGPRVVSFVEGAGDVSPLSGASDFSFPEPSRGIGLFSGRDGCRS
ncbi:hypothetical protein, partial [Acetobacter oeni]|uniref:hypothetical protein n=1 Tax=Acetobacter oeni TaxID=304077 RepID=UPI002231CFFE